MEGWTIKTRLAILMMSMGLCSADTLTSGNAVVTFLPNSGFGTGICSFTIGGISQAGLGCANRTPGNSWFLTSLNAGAVRLVSGARSTFTDKEIADNERLLTHSVKNGYSLTIDLELAQNNGVTFLSKTIQINNTSAAAEAWNVFLYDDYNLNGQTKTQTADWQDAEELKPGRFLQHPGTAADCLAQNECSQVMASATAFAGEEGTNGLAESFGAGPGSVGRGTLFRSISQGNSLDDTASYTGDAAFALEWAFSLQPGKNVAFGDTEVLRIANPEPATACLCGLVLCGISVLGSIGKAKENTRPHAPAADLSVEREEPAKRVGTRLDTKIRRR
jgi:hypothetical protein